ncbi:heavy-metal-associated domain-containing protein [Cohaesibacter celericrescens]|jgi:copper chaperone|uniref:Copper chaperone n=1 Tax=Cohaesibacter celericrescens TaxID=2067669 RepID=A0A2N5XKS3_9HYPH|nr:heavy-metal-associated domain-containing protein [Cohaesibacter celericrescens]PLW75038.1 copper chaperone [Cohaesibacter celericrescens]
MIKLNVQDMACGGCIKSIKEAIMAKDTTADVNADLETGAVEVTSSLSPDAIRDTIIEAGFPAQLA